MILYRVPFLATFLVIVKATATNTNDADVTRASSAEYVQSSPAWLANVKVPTNVVTQLPFDDEIKAGPLPKEPFKLDLNSYPKPNKQPPVDHPEVQAVLKHLDFSIIPKSKPRIVKDWVFDMKDYNRTDPDCWWSSSLCKKPKVSYLPEDISICPNKGTWGLNYDDGPYKMWWPTSEKQKEYDQPRFYNYLVEKGKQKATLFFVGSNVINFPEAAQRSLSDGHTICSHTWSHPQMTTLTNEEVVAQLYWTHKAIKETMGITPKCWRPPYGDVDDRVRAIAYQMGMRTILWDQDSNDWNLITGRLKTEVVDNFFKGWVDNRVSGNDTDHGHITLQHENSNMTIQMSEKWLPILQKTFKVMPIHQCINDPHPYWEESWTYPTLDVPEPPRQRSSAGNLGANTSMASSSYYSNLAEAILNLSLLGFAVAATLI
ncbi:family 4 carbohydrate esterase [Mucor ambiguus]|uniref:Family 4 carbohydrate esterase n=1 Tax=Mucor ambiguus TaxID=91626 RepID=A0A0C9MJT8_9FUNG|nr:family 4 carbohydrate esterase [Mucor ambiguus]